MLLGSVDKKVCVSLRLIMQIHYPKILLLHTGEKDEGKQDRSYIHCGKKSG